MHISVHWRPPLGTSIAPFASRPRQTRAICRKFLCFFLSHKRHTRRERCHLFLCRRLRAPCRTRISSSISSSVTQVRSSVAREEDQGPIPAASGRALFCLPIHAHSTCIQYSTYMEDPGREHRTPSPQGSTLILPLILCAVISHMFVLLGSRCWKVMLVIAIHGQAISAGARLDDWCGVWRAHD